MPQHLRHQVSSQSTHQESFMEISSNEVATDGGELQVYIEQARHIYKFYVYILYVYIISIYIFPQGSMAKTTPRE